MSKYLTQVWQGEQKKMDAFFEGMDAKIAADTIAHQAARIAELEAALEKTLDTLRIYSYTEYLDAEAARALLAQKG